MIGGANSFFGITPGSLRCGRRAGGFSSSRLPSIKVTKSRRSTSSIWSRTSASARGAKGGRGWCALSTGEQPAAAHGWQRFRSDDGGWMLSHHRQSRRHNGNQSGPPPGFSFWPCSRWPSTGCGSHHRPSRLFRVALWKRSLPPVNRKIRALTAATNFIAGAIAVGVILLDCSGGVDYDTLDAIAGSTIYMSSSSTSSSAVMRAHSGKKGFEGGGPVTTTTTRKNNSEGPPVTGRRRWTLSLRDIQGIEGWRSGPRG